MRNALHAAAVVAGGILTGEGRIISHVAITTYVIPYTYSNQTPPFSCYLSRDQAAHSAHARRRASADYYNAGKVAEEIMKARHRGDTNISIDSQAEEKRKSFKDLSKVHKSLHAKLDRAVDKV